MLAAVCALLLPMPWNAPEPMQISNPQQNSKPQDLFAVGNQLPDLELPTLDGKSKINLSKLRGQKLLLIQFASW